MSSTATLIEASADLAVFCENAELQLNRYFQRKAERPSYGGKFYASELGDPCDRYLTYRLREWDKAEPVSVGLMRIFEEGHFQAKAIAETLASAGFEIDQTELPFPPNSWNIGGRMDFRIDGIVAEAKAVSPHMFDRYTLDYIRTFDKDHYYVHRYYVQMQMYLFLYNTTYEKDLQGGVFVIKNKSTGEIKFIPCPIDYDAINTTIERIERLKALPGLADRNVGQRCTDCQYRTACLPGIEGGISPIEVLDDDTIRLKLDRYFELGAAATERDALAKELKGQFQIDGERGFLETLIGPYEVVSKWRTRKGYQVKDAEFCEVRFKRRDLPEDDE